MRMCGVSLQERKTSEMLRMRLGIMVISIVMRRNRLRWLGDVDKIEEKNWVRKCRRLEVWSGERKYESEVLTMEMAHVRA